MWHNRCSRCAGGSGQSPCPADDRNVAGRVGPFRCSTGPAGGTSHPTWATLVIISDVSAVTCFFACDCARTCALTGTATGSKSPYSRGSLLSSGRDNTVLCGWLAGMRAPKSPTASRTPGSTRADAEHPSSRRAVLRRKVVPSVRAVTVPRNHGALACGPSPHWRLCSLNSQSGYPTRPGEALPAGVVLPVAARERDTLRGYALPFAGYSACFRSRPTIAYT